MPDYFIINVWITLTNLRYSSTFLPTGRSLTLMCLRTWLSSIINDPLKLIPASFKTPYFAETYLFKSAINGMSISPKPPSLLGFFVHYMCEKCESTEHPTTSQPISLNSWAFLEKSTISVGQTKVKSSG